MTSALSENKTASRLRLSGFPWRRALPFLRLAMTVVMVYVLFAKVQWASVDQIGRRGIGFIAVAFALTLAGIFLSGVRWRSVLASMEVPSRVRDLVELQLAGMFAGNFMPSTVGGDIVRATWLAKINKASADSAASVVLERLTGWLVLPVLVLVGTITDPSLLRLGGVSKLILLIAVATLVGLAVLITVAGSSSLSARASRIHVLAVLLRSMGRGISNLQRKPAVLARLITWAVLYQVCVLVASIFAARALNIEIGWRALLVFVPTVAMLQVLPLTIGGLGVREGALVLMLHPLGIGSAQAIAFGLLVYALNIGASLLGAPTLALGSGRMSQRGAGAADAGTDDR